MNIRTNFGIDAEIESDKREIIQTVTWIKKIKEQLEAHGSHISGRTMDKVKQYVANIQAHIEGLEHKSKAIENCFEELKNIDGVTPRIYQAVKYRYLNGMNIEDIAEQLGTSKQWVHELINRGNKHLKPMLEKCGVILNDEV